MSIPKALTIAGTDSGGGAGVQADIKTFQELGVYGMSAVTAVTAQNTLGVQGVYPMEPEAVARQLDSIGEDLSPEAVKTGMLFSSEIIEIVAAKIRQYRWNRLVVDPVMVAKGGQTLLQREALKALTTSLLPLTLLVTPNLPEAELLTGRRIENWEDRMDAARAIYAMGARHVLVKGGHDDNDRLSADLLYDGEAFHRLEGTRIYTRSTHGTGCTFSAAAAAELAKGRTVREACATAKAFIQAAIEHPLEIGSGHGPTNHFAYKLLRGSLH